jgi:hypothetical protein
LRTFFNQSTDLTALNRLVVLGGAKTAVPPWSEPHWIIDTAVMSAEEAVTAIGARMTE